jgi:hypothetical protein
VSGRAGAAAAHAPSSFARSKPEDRIIPLQSADRRLVMEPTSGVAEELGQHGLYPDRWTVCHSGTVGPHSFENGELLERVIELSLHAGERLMWLPSTGPCRLALPDSQAPSSASRGRPSDIATPPRASHSTEG